MRTISADGQQLLGLSIQERSDSFVVEIDRDGNGTWVNLRDYEGVDWIDSVQWEDNEESPVNEATVMLRRKFDDMSLSPLMAQSKLNASGTLVWPKRRIRVRVNNLDRGNFASSGGDVVFDGHIAKIDFNSDPMTLQCRDLGGALQDAFIETQKIYGTDAGRDIEDVIQDILDDANTNGWLLDAVTLHTPTSPGFAVKKYKQGKESVMEAIQKLARLIGYQCKYRWRAGTSQFELTLYAPNREVKAQGSLTVTGAPTAGQQLTVNATTLTEGTDFTGVGQTALQVATNIKDALLASAEASNVNAWVDDDGANPKVVIEWQTPGTAGNSITFTEGLDNATADGGGTLGGTQTGAAISVDQTFGPDQYWNPEGLSIDVQNVRNAFSLTYAIPGADSDDYTRVTVTRRNSASITKYGRRFFGITEDANSQIDTTEEAQAMLAAAEADLAEPSADLVIPMIYFPWGEAGDYYTFEADGIHFDSNQTLGVVSLRHSATGGQVRTVAVCRGKPSLGPGRWLEIEARAGVAPRTDLFSDTPDAPSVEAGLGSIIVTFDDPRTQDPPIEDWAYTEVYVDTSTIADPGAGKRPSVGLLKAKGRQTRFEIAGLTPGTTYYSAVFHVDRAGNVSNISTVVSVATAYVGPFHKNPDTDFGSIIHNSEFGVWSPPNDDKTTNPPDGWQCVDTTSLTLDNSLWGSGSDNVYFDTAEGQTGGNAIKITSGTSEKGVQSIDFHPVTEGSIVRVECGYKRNTSGDAVRLIWQWFEEDKSTQVGSTQFFNESGTSTSWTDIVQNVEVPANARYIRVAFILNENSGTHTVYLDRLHVTRIFPACRVYRLTAQAITSGSPQLTNLNTESYDYGDNFDTSSTYLFTAPESGTYLISAQAGVLASSDATFVQASIYKNGSLLQAGSKAYNSSGGSAAIMSTVSIYTDISKGDTLGLYVEHDEGGNLNLDIGATDSVLSIARVM